MYEASAWMMESPGWRIDESEESIAFLPCDGDDAALTVSAFRNTIGAIADDELREMAGRASPAGAIHAPVTCGEFRGLHARYEHEGVAWRVWWLALGATHLYVTFNCDPATAGTRDAVLDWMMTTLRLSPSHS
ncbi:MAG: hypothetical protein ABJD07_10945 [Gemmatimonadaceae bacterium]